MKFFKYNGVSFMTDSISLEEDVGTVQVRLMTNGKYETPFTVDVMCFEKPAVETKVPMYVLPKNEIYFVTVLQHVWCCHGNQSVVCQLQTLLILPAFVHVVMVTLAAQSGCQPRDVPAVQLKNPRFLETSIDQGNIKTEPLCII